MELGNATTLLLLIGVRGPYVFLKEQLYHMQIKSMLGRNNLMYSLINAGSCMYGWSQYMQEFMVPGHNTPWWAQTITMIN